MAVFSCYRSVSARRPGAGCYVDVAGARTSDTHPVNLRPLRHALSPRPPPRGPGAQPDQSTTVEWRARRSCSESTRAAGGRRGGDDTAAAAVPGGTQDHPRRLPGPRPADEPSGDASVETAIVHRVARHSINGFSATGKAP